MRTAACKLIRTPSGKRFSDCCLLNLEVTLLAGRRTIHQRVFPLMELNQAYSHVDTISHTHNRPADGAVARRLLCEIGLNWQIDRSLSKQRCREGGNHEYIT
jgi:isopentenyldiphosphate isomerase